MFDHCYLEHCKLSEWSEWTWNIPAQSCGDGHRRRDVEVNANDNGNTCEQVYGCKMKLEYPGQISTCLNETDI